MVKMIGLRVQGSGMGMRVPGLGLRVKCSGFLGVEGLGFIILASRSLRIQRVEDLGFGGFRG